MSVDAWLTVCVIALCFGLLTFTRYAPDIVMAGAVSILLLSGVLSTKEALAGFANEGMITVAVLYVVVTGLKETGGITWIVQSVLGRPSSVNNGLIRLMSPVMAISAFLNNTPVVAMFIPAVQEWAKRNQLSVSKFMIPLTYGASVGGMCTLIGTSTNLIVNGMLVSQTNMPSLHLFDLAWVGVPCALIAMVYIVMVHKWLLPERRPVFSQFGDARQYTVEMMVDADSPLINKSIEQAGLRQLPGMYLIEIDRGDQLLPAVSPQELLQANDRLVFAGVVDSVVDLQRIRGLSPATDQVFKLNSSRRNRCLIEAVVSNSCPLVGKSIREGRFRNVYNAAVIAVARNGEQIRRKLGDIVLAPGDTLLLEAHPSFLEHRRNSRDFFLISRLHDSEPLCHEKAPLAVLIMLGMIVVASFEWLSMLQAALLAAGLMLITRCTSGRVARRGVDWQVLVVVAASFGLGVALDRTGVAKIVAENLLQFAHNDPLLALALVFIATAIFTELVTNNAAAILMFPIALATAHKLDVSFMPFVITVMIAASASFATPIGYQTNLMVQGPGGNHFADFMKIGIPLSVLVGLVTILIVPIVWPF